MNKREQPAPDEGVWVKTEHDPIAGHYVVTVELDADHAIGITHNTATAYASAIYAALARAEHDALVYAQLRARVTDAHAGSFIRDMRADRPDLDQAALSPLSITPGVNHEGTPFLALAIDGQPVGQWTTDDAREHAGNVLEAIQVADLDTSYYRALLNFAQVEHRTALSVVADLAVRR